MCGGPNVLTGYWRRQRRPRRSAAAGFIPATWAASTRGLPHPGRPQEGHDHHRRRERLPDRGRAGAVAILRYAKSPSSGCRTPNWGETPIAVVALNEGAQTTGEDLIITPEVAWRTSSVLPGWSMCRNFPATPPARCSRRRSARSMAARRRLCSGDEGGARRCILLQCGDRSSALLVIHQTSAIAVSRSWPTNADRPSPRARAIASLWSSANRCV